MPWNRDLADASMPGMRHVMWVRIDLRADRPICEVGGVGHRHPVRRQVPLGLASRLIAAGVPSIILGRQDEPVGPTASATEIA